MPVIEISSLTHPGVEIFSTLTEAQLRNRLEPDKGLFIAESPKVIKVALDAGYEPLAFLCEHKHIYGDAAEIIERCGDIPVYTSGRELLAELTGYVLTRGVLCAMRRPVPKSMEDVCRGARRIVVIDGVVDTTNIGAIFRSAAALGMDAVLSASISFVVSVIFNYVASMCFVFTRRDDLSRRREFIIFVVLSVVGLVINEIIMAAGVAVLGDSALMVTVTKLVATAIVMVWNFFSRKKWLDAGESE